MLLVINVKRAGFMHVTRSLSGVSYHLAALIMDLWIINYRYFKVTTKSNVLVLKVTTTTVATMHYNTKRALITVVYQ